MVALLHHSVAVSTVMSLTMNEENSVISSSREQEGRKSLQSPVRRQIMIDLIVLVPQLYIILLAEVPPAKWTQDQLGSHRRKHSEATHQSSKPLGGFLRYLRLYSDTACESVRLCLATLSFHRFSARSINTEIGCRPRGLTSSSPLGWKVC